MGYYFIFFKLSYTFHYSFFFSFIQKASAFFCFCNCTSPLQDHKKCKCWCASFHRRWDVGCFRLDTGFCHFASLRNFKYWLHSHWIVYTKLTILKQHFIDLWNKIKLKLICEDFLLFSELSWIHCIFVTDQQQHIQLLTHRSYNLSDVSHVYKTWLEFFYPLSKDSLLP